MGGKPSSVSIVPIIAGEDVGKVSSKIEKIPEGFVEGELIEVTPEEEPIVDCVAESREETCGDWVCGERENNCDEMVGCGESDGECPVNSMCLLGECKAINCESNGLDTISLVTTGSLKNVLSDFNSSWLNMWLFPLEDLIPNYIPLNEYRVNEYIIEFTSGEDIGERYAVSNVIDYFDFSDAGIDTINDAIIIYFATKANAGDTFNVCEREAFCGDGFCSMAMGEGPSNCPEDCGMRSGSPCSSGDQCYGGYCVHEFCRGTPEYCGDLFCDARENCSSCVVDCGVCPSGDGFCSLSEGCASSVDCGDCPCGDGFCRDDEDNWNCWADCEYGPCGDGVCAVDESPADCSEDCGQDIKTDIYDNLDSFQVYSGWYNGVEDSGKTFYISPTVYSGSGTEQMHHWITIDYTSTSGGKVDVVMGHNSSDDISGVMNKSSKKTSIVSMQSGETNYVTTISGSEKYSWVILEVDSDVIINKINHTYWVGHDTYYGHKAREFKFAGSYLLYRIAYPMNYDRAKDYPLIVVASGSMEAGEDNRQQIAASTFSRPYFSMFSFDEDLQAFTINVQFHSNGSYIPLPYYAGSYYSDGQVGGPIPVYHPSSPSSNKGGFYASGVVALVKSMVENPNINIDESRIYYTGMSLGGYASYEIAKQAPDLWAAIWPTSSWAIGTPYDKFIEDEPHLPPCALARACDDFPDLYDIMSTKLAEEVSIYKDIPFRIGSGETDGMVFGGEMVCDEINRQGGTCIHNIIPGGTHHTGATRSYSNEEYVRWLFDQVKN